MRISISGDVGAVELSISVENESGRISTLPQSPVLAGLTCMSGVGGAVEPASGSEVRLPSKEGGAVDAGRSRLSRNSAAGDIGIFGGGLGGTKGFF